MEGHSFKNNPGSEQGNCGRYRGNGLQSVLTLILKQPVMCGDINRKNTRTGPLPEGFSDLLITMKDTYE
jgi:hypothetical protein